jgi:DNA-directed RNA polymerase subunit H (RpoH/RPB5)
MANQEQSSLISSIYNSRRIILELMENQGFNIEDYSNFSINEVNSMKVNDQLDMLLEKKPDKINSNVNNKIYIKYFISKMIKPAVIHQMIDDLFGLAEILTKNDILYIIIKDDVNETIKTELIQIWEKDGIFIVIENIKRLQFNILKHCYVPEHIIMTNNEVDQIMKKYNITDEIQFPDISRFDPVAKAICLRPGMVCKINRPSKSSITADMYRRCINIMI